MRDSTSGVVDGGPMETTLIRCRMFAVLNQGGVTPPWLKPYSQKTRCVCMVTMVMLTQCWFNTVRAFQSELFNRRGIFYVEL